MQRSNKNYFETPAYLRRRTIKDLTSTRPNDSAGVRPPADEGRVPFTLEDKDLLAAVADLCGEFVPPEQPPKPPVPDSDDPKESETEAETGYIPHWEG